MISKEMAVAGTAKAEAVACEPRGLMLRLFLSLCLCFAASFAHAVPTVLSIVADHTPVQAGEAFSLTVTYDTPMDPSINPVISFPTAGEDAAPFLIGTTSTWLDAMTFRQNYEGDYVTVNVTTVDVAVAGAKDTLGTAQQPGFQANVFDITPFVLYIPPPHVVDMKGELLPDNLLVHPAGSGHVITDADVGKTVQFTIRYDITTNYDGCPVGVTLNYLCTNIVFTNTNGTPLTLTNATSVWMNRNRYIVTWTIADGDEQFDSINVVIAGGVGRKDDPNNKNTDFELTGVFSIDTKNPTVSVATPSAASISNGVPVGGGFTVTVAYSEAMDTSTTPSLSFPNQNLGAVLTATTGTWTDNRHYVQSFVIGGGYAIFPAVDVKVTGARDANGNLQREGMMAGVFGVNLPAPAQAITNFIATPPSGKVGGTATLFAIAGASGNPVTYSGGPAGVCTVGANVVTFVGAGTCAVTADEAGSAGFSAAPQLTLNIAVSLATQAITNFVATPPSGTAGGTTTLSATAGASGNPVIFGSGTAGVCTVSGNTVTFVGVGTCAVNANEAGNATYSAAPQVSLNIAVAADLREIPTMSQWGLLLLTCLLGFAAVRHGALRRDNRRLVFRFHAIAGNDEKTGM